MRKAEVVEDGKGNVRMYVMGIGNGGISRVEIREKVEKK
jgi:hypothetical protein